MKKLMILLLLAMPIGLRAESGVPELERGASMFQYQCEGYFEGINLDVYYYIPQQGDIKDMKVQFVMHGVNRNADSYRDSWISYAEQYGLIILSPMFDKANFPTSKYQYGNVADDQGGVNSPDKMTYSLIDDIFASFVQKYGLNDATYRIYGHSAGAQFVHRFVMFYRSPYLDRAVAANSGTYTFPSDEVKYPFGCLGVGGVETLTEKVFETKLVVLLAEGDTIRDDDLNVSAEADNQGLNRWERGNRFLEKMREFAEQQGYPFCWERFTLPGAAHSNKKMSELAAEVLYGNYAGIRPVVRRFPRDGRWYDVGGKVVRGSRRGGLLLGKGVKGYFLFLRPAGSKRSEIERSGAEK